MSSLPYRQIPAYPDEFSAGNVLARLVDGLGFRYYWATEGLPGDALAYRPAESCRSTRETLNHILNIVTMVSQAFTGEPYDLPEPDPGLSLEDLRQETLGRIEWISEQLKTSTEADFAGRTAQFRIGERQFEYPFWNTINGTMADAIYHVGQVVSFRRATGNPIDPGVHVYLGTRVAR